MPQHYKINPRLRAILITTACACAVSCTSAQGMTLKYESSLAAQQSHLDRTTKKTVKDPDIHEKDELVIQLGSDRIKISSPKETDVFDFKNRRLLVINDKTKTYTDSSLYMLCGFRAAEVRNRMFINQVLEAANVEKNFSGTSFDIGSELGMPIPGGLENPGITISTDNGKTVFKYRGNVVTEVTFKPEDASACMPMYSKLLLYHCHLHPYIRKQIVASNHIIDSLSYSFVEAEGARTESLRLIDQSPADADLNVPANYRRTFSPSPISQFQEQIFASDKVNMSAPDAVVAQAQSLVAQNRSLDACLTLIEYSLATGEQATPEMFNILKQLTTNPLVVQLQNAVEPNSKEDALKALGVLEKLRVQCSQKAYIIDLYRANISETLGQNPRTLFLSALKGNNLLTGAYKDFGMYCYRSYDMQLAWDCWDLARRIRPDDSILGEVTSLEKNLSDTYPEYF